MYTFNIFKDNKKVTLAKFNIENNNLVINESVVDKDVIFRMLRELYSDKYDSISEDAMEYIINEKNNAYYNLIKEKVNR